MKAYEALFKAIDDIKHLLTQAGLVDGTKISNDVLKSTKDVLFWFIEVKSADASSKQTYVTYNVSNISPYTYGDGKPLNYTAIVNLEIFTNKDDIRALITTINDNAAANYWSFDLSSPVDYDQTSKLYTYRFELRKVVP